MGVVPLELVQRHRPLLAQHLLPGLGGEQDVAEDQGIVEAAERRGACVDAGRRGQGVGRQGGGGDGDRLPGQARPEIAGHEAAGALLVLRADLGQVQGVEKLRFEVAGEVQARDRLDHQAQQPIGEVGVLHAGAGVDDQGLGPEELDQRLAVGEIPLEEPEIRSRAVAHHACRMRHELPQGDPGQARIRVLGEPGQVPDHRIVEPEPPGVRQVQDRRRGEGLGMRGDPEEMPGRQRLLRGQIGAAPGPLEENVAVLRDRDREARHRRIVLLLKGQPVLEIGEGGPEAVAVRHAASTWNNVLLESIGDRPDEGNPLEQPAFLRTRTGCPSGKRYDRIVGAQLNPM